MNDVIEKSESLEAAVSKPKILKGVRYFASLSVAGMAILFLYSSTPQTLSAFGHFRYRFLWLALALAALDLWLGGLRTQLFMRSIKPGVAPFLGFRANLANEFMAAITPTQSGGAPAWMFILYRSGIPIPVSLSISIITFMSTLLYFAVMAGISWMIIRERFTDAGIVYIIQYSFLALSAVILLMVTAVCRPKLILKIIRAPAKWLSGKSVEWNGRVSAIIDRLISGVEQFHSTVTHFIHMRPILLLYCFALTILLYTTKFTLAFVILLGLGVHSNYLQVIAIQAVLRLTLYFAPTPGGSGIAELSIAAMMNVLLEGYLLPVFTLLYRFFQIYLPGSLGAFVMMNELRHSGTRG